MKPPKSQLHARSQSFQASWRRHTKADDTGPWVQVHIVDWSAFRDEIAIHIMGEWTSQDIECALWRAARDGFTRIICHKYPGNVVSLRRRVG